MKLILFLLALGLLCTLGAAQPYTSTGTQADVSSGITYSYSSWYPYTYYDWWYPYTYPYTYYGYPYTYYYYPYTYYYYPTYFRYYPYTYYYYWYPSSYTTRFYYYSGY